MHNFRHKASLGSSHAVWWPPRQAETPDVIVLFIPGNPGLVDFYIPFLSAIYEKLISTNVAIFARAHLDHAPQILDAHLRIASLFKSKPLSKSWILYSTTILRRTRIVVIGHSVKACISLQVGNFPSTHLGSAGSDAVIKLIKARSNQVTAVFLLFPTISYIGDTPNGKKLAVSKAWYHKCKDASLVCRHKASIQTTTSIYIIVFVTASKVSAFLRLLDVVSQLAWAAGPCVA